MTIIQAKAQDQVLLATTLPKVACNNKKSVRLVVAFSAEWNNYPAKQAIFTTSNDPTPYPVDLSSIDGCTVPHEVLADAGRLFIWIRGVNASGEEKTTTAISYKILPGTPSLVVSDPSPSVYHQLLAKSAELQSRMSGLEAAGTVEGSEVIGVRTGIDGTVYPTAGDAVRGQVEKAYHSITPQTAFVVIDKVNIADRPYASENVESGVYTIYLPPLLISLGTKNENVKATTVTFTPDGQSNLHYIYFDFDSKTYGVTYWRHFYDYANRKNTALIGLFRLEMRCVELFEIPQRYDGFLPFVSVIVGQNTNGKKQPLPTIDTKARLMSFPTDTILRVTNGYGVHYILTDAAENTTCDFSHFASSAVHIIFDTVTQKLYSMPYGDWTITIEGEKVPVFFPRFCLVCSIRTYDGVCSCLFPYICDGKFMGQDLDMFVARSQNLNTVKAINHRGYNFDAPENTLAAFRLSKEKGFAYVECDVSFTSDGYAVLLHDGTIDRTSNGTGSIAEKTLAEVRALDFGSWKSADYAGEKIPTFEEFILLCKRLGLHPYIELKAGTEAQIKGLVDVVKRYGMKGKVTWISFDAARLGYVKAVDTSARLGFVVGEVTASTITTVKQTLRTGKNEVFIDCSASNANDAAVALCANDDIPLEVWTVNAESTVLALDPYVSGVTSDNLIAGKILADAEMNN